MTPYNGHRSWNAWNVSLWLHNDEGLYRFAADLIKRHGPKRGAAKVGAALAGQRTPDGAVYNHLTVKLALADWT